MLFVKYLQIAKNTLQVYFAYRASFIFWRLQLIISFVIYYSLWHAVGQGKANLGSYSIPELYSYFVFGYIIRTLVFSTITADIGGDIQNGHLSTLLLKPISIIKYYFARDVVDKLFNLFFMVFEFSLIILIYRPPLVWPDLAHFIVFLVSLLLSIITFFFYSLVVSFITFWADNAWSSRFLFGVVFVNLFSGQYIPLDFLPTWISRILDYTPFPYLYFYPLKIWLGQLTTSASLERLLPGALTMLFVYFLSRVLWLAGKQKYQSYGN